MPPGYHEQSVTHPACLPGTMEEYNTPSMPPGTMGEWHIRPACLPGTIGRVVYIPYYASRVPLGGEILHPACLPGTMEKRVYTPCMPPGYHGGRGIYTLHASRAPWWVGVSLPICPCTMVGYTPPYICLPVPPWVYLHPCATRCYCGVLRVQGSGRRPWALLLG